MIGYVAATGDFGIEPGTLFAVQFMWQFPHFWSIAWLSHDDYLRAGYKMMPFNAGRSERSAQLILLYTLFCIPASMLPWALNQPMVGMLLSPWQWPPAWVSPSARTACARGCPWTPRST